MCAVLVERGLLSVGADLRSAGASMPHRLHERLRLPGGGASLQHDDIGVRAVPHEQRLRRHFDADLQRRRKVCAMYRR
jgi:hypothetical protein